MRSQPECHRLASRSCPASIPAAPSAGGSLRGAPARGASLIALALAVCVGSSAVCIGSSAAAQDGAVVGLDTISDEASTERVLSDAAAAAIGSGRLRYVEDQLIVRLRPGAARRIRRGSVASVTADLEPDEARAFTELVRRSRVRGLRRVFRSLEDDDGRLRERASARVTRLRNARQARRPQQRLPAAAPDEIPALETFFVVDVPANADVDALEAALADLVANELVESAQPNYIHRLMAEPLPPATWIPNDPHLSPDGAHWAEGAVDPAFPDLYGLRSVRALEAWSLFDENGDGEFGPGETAPGDGIVVAVIDTGLDLDHPDIAANVWSNPGEIPGNGIDDDGNGFVDDIVGWDFTNDDADVSDEHGHGTHCAGTIAARGDDGAGIVGVAPFAQILPVQGLDAGGSGTTAELAAAVEYATLMGADVLSNSWGGIVIDPTVEAAFEAAAAAGAVSIAAAGNDARNSLLMPARFESVIAVCAVDHVDELGWFSSYGLEVDVCAPGVSILSLSANDHDSRLGRLYTNHDPSRIVGDRHLVLNGTSMAAPHAAGVAALSLSLHPAEGRVDTRARLIAGARSIDAQNPGFKGQLGNGLIDAAAALALDPQPLLRVSGSDSTPLVADRWLRLDVDVTNDWLATTGVEAEIVSLDPRVAVRRGGPIALGDLGPEEQGTARFRLQTSSALVPGDAVLLQVTMWDSTGWSQTSSLQLRAAFFADETERSGLRNSSIVANGANFFDFDLDGAGDFGVGAFTEGVKLYRNDGRSSFTRSTPAVSNWGRVPYLFDFDGDGHRDLLAAGGGGGFPSAALGLNDGFGDFSAVTQEFGPSSAYAGTPIDLEGDGDLDLVMTANSSCPTGTVRNHYVYENDGAGYFTDVSADWGLPECPERAHQIIAFDADDDGRQDLLIASEQSDAALISLYRNAGGSFVDVTATALPDVPTGCRSNPDCNPVTQVAIGDRDGDGDLDILAAGGNPFGGQSLYLFDNDGSGVFVESTDEAGDLGSRFLMMGKWGTTFFDLDNDGDLDILLPFNTAISGVPDFTMSPTNVVLRNRGDGTFDDVSDILFPKNRQLASFIVAVGDYDRDGGLDILGAAGTTVAEKGGLLRSVAATPHHWLQVELRSTTSAPGGFGAKLRLTAGGRTQVRAVHSSPMDSSFEHFGLGAADVVDALVIEWPSGIVQTLRNVAVDQRRTVGEIASTCADGADDDADGVCSDVDNCLLAPNGPGDARNQVDSDGDGFGDDCDLDLDGDGFVGFGDVSMIAADIGLAAGDAGFETGHDANGDGRITLLDAQIARDALGTAPGPAAEAPAPAE